MLVSEASDTDSTCIPKQRLYLTSFTAQCSPDVLPGACRCLTMLALPDVLPDSFMMDARDSCCAGGTTPTGSWGRKTQTQEATNRRQWG